MQPTQKSGAADAGSLVTQGRNRDWNHWTRSCATGDASRPGVGCAL